eukprot:2430016-Pyramimonas_sp.AAC.1
MVNSTVSVSSPSGVRVSSREPRAENMGVDVITRPEGVACTWSSGAAAVGAIGSMAPDKGSAGDPVSLGKVSWRSVSVIWIRVNRSASFSNVPDGVVGDAAGTHMLRSALLSRFADLGLRFNVTFSFLKVRFTHRSLPGGDPRKISKSQLP